jgi:flagellar export protein FliJ
MNTRRKKIQRVLDVRKQALDERARQLSESRAQLQEALDDHSRESEHLAAAQKYRETVASGTTDIASFIEAEQWLMHRKQLVHRADGKVAEAESDVHRAWQGVVDARIDKKRIELLDERLVEGEKREENRLERRLSDELSLRSRK